MIIVAYVDDLLILSNNGDLIELFITFFMKGYDSKEQRKLSKFLEMNVRDKGHSLKLEHRDMITH